MKKSVLALAVASLVATSASAATVYDKDGTSLAIGGRVEALYFSGAADKAGDNQQTIRDRMRVNLRGQTKIADWATGYGFVEWESQHEGDSTEAQGNKLRYNYVGVDFGMGGKVQVGRWEGIFNDVGALTDHFEEQGELAQFGDKRNSGKIAYMWKGYGVNAGVEFQSAVNNFACDDFTRAVTNGKVKSFAAKNGFAVEAGYTSPEVLFGPISFQAGYQLINGQDKKFGSAPTGADPSSVAYNVDDYKAWGAALSWGTFTKGPYVAVGYTHGKMTFRDDVNANGVRGTGANPIAKDVKVKAIESIVSYGLDCGVVFDLGYQYRKTEQSGVNDDATRKILQAAVVYNINPNFRVWGEAQWDCSSDGDPLYGTGDDGEDGYLVGVRYTF